MCAASVHELSLRARRPITAPDAHWVGALLWELDRLRVEEGIHLLRQPRAIVSCKRCAPSVHIASLGPVSSICHSCCPTAHDANPVTPEKCQNPDDRRLLLGCMSGAVHAQHPCSCVIMVSQHATGDNQERLLIITAASATNTIVPCAEGALAPLCLQGFSAKVPCVATPSYTRSDAQKAQPGRTVAVDCSIVPRQRLRVLDVEDAAAASERRRRGLHVYRHPRRRRVAGRGHRRLLSERARHEPEQVKRLFWVSVWCSTLRKRNQVFQG